MFRLLSPTFRHALLVVLGGFAFALAGCLGSIAVFSYDSQSPYGFIGVAALFIGLLIMLVGGVLLVIAVLKNCLESKLRTLTSPAR